MTGMPGKVFGLFVGGGVVGELVGGGVVGGLMGLTLGDFDGLEEGFRERKKTFVNGELENYKDMETRETYFMTLPKLLGSSKRSKDKT